MPLPSALLLVLAAAYGSVALPTTDGWYESSSRGHYQHNQSAITLPLNGLPAPSTISPQISLKYITLGIGHQNYSCAEESAKPVAIGATASLSDAMPFFKQHPDMISDLPGLALSISAANKQRRVDTTDEADFSTRFGNLHLLGHHFFSADKAPNFVLANVSPPGTLVATKLDDVPAPEGSSPGPDGAAAVDWLLLNDNGQGRSSGGLSHVYRVETAGGSPPSTCAGIAPGSVIRVPYSAEYWFYGP